MLRISRVISVLLLAVLSVNFGNAQASGKNVHSNNAASSAPAGSLPTEGTVNEFLKHMFGYDGSLTWKVQSIKPSQDPHVAEVNILMTGSQGQQFTRLYITPDQHYAMLGEMIPFGADPFAPARAELQKGAHGPSTGPATAPVTLVEFSDLQCPHCKAAQPILERLLNEDKNVRLVFQTFPLPSHDWAFKGAAFADCVSRENNDAFWKFIKSVFDNQENITAANADAKLTELATAAGANGKNAAACSTRADTKTRVEESVNLGKAKDVDVEGTPTVFVNGRKIGSIAGVPFETLKQIVDYSGKFGK